MKRHTQPLCWVEGGPRRREVSGGVSGTWDCERRTYNYYGILNRKRERERVLLNSSFQFQSIMKCAFLINLFPQEQVASVVIVVVVIIIFRIINSLLIIHTTLKKTPLLNEALEDAPAPAFMQSQEFLSSSLSTLFGDRRGRGSLLFSFFLRPFILQLRWS